MSGSWDAMLAAEEEVENALQRRRALARMTKAELVDAVRMLELLLDEHGITPPTSVRHEVSVAASGGFTTFGVAEATKHEIRRHDA
ncbi:hypothetical protein [uncultured Microbacterium sp.]|uniref:hypothetical protein n=1 Tax=uncultured Microbacterium sp. TaxID=191216 RepID=UPI0026137227|nr:hypothetical protein [uncultured Microbacterium sp.]